DEAPKSSFTEPSDETMVFHAPENSAGSPKSGRTEPSDDTVIFKKSAADPDDDEVRIWQGTGDAAQAGGEYAPSEDYSRPEPDENAPREPDLKEKLLAPLIGLISAAATRRQAKFAEERKRAAKEKAHQLPELRPEKAALLYENQSQSLLLRCFFATALCLVLMYLSYGFPAIGLLGSSLKIRTLVCLIVELVVMLVGLDVFTNGIITLFKGKPGAESLIAVSCLVSVLDAGYMVFFGKLAFGLPFSAVSALSVTFALWGSYFACQAYAISFHTAAAAKNPSVVLSKSGGDEGGRVLAKAKRPVTGFVRESESADIFENAYRLFAPLLLIAAVILSLFCVLASKKCEGFLHTLSACTAVSASFSAIFGFAFPFSVLAKRLSRSGVAIAGCAGCAELSKTRRVAITDTDVFPVRTLSVADITLAEGISPDKVVSYTGSMISAAGMGIAPVFTELMKKNGCTMKKVEDFACHEGGGIVARINGDQVYVGSSSFMQLMGIRLPKGSNSKSAVFTAINDDLAGAFEINYVPVTSVQRALVSLLRGKAEPVFAVRDFNITPMLIKQKFRLPPTACDFPPFADRYRISSPDVEDAGTVVAMFSRGGLNSVAGLAKRGKKLYFGLQLCTALSVLGVVLGMIIMLATLWTGSYAAASCGNMLTFMILWLVPVLVISFGLRI
ncbi:MAG: hypothetical protein RRY04_04425, partial [Oscillospiraceae bacterium]